MSLAEHILHLQFCLTVGAGILVVVAIVYAAYAYLVGRSGRNGGD